MFVYCMYLMVFDFKMTVSGFCSQFIFVLYSWAFSQMFGIMCGAISVIASWCFVSVLYKSSKTD